MLKTLFEKIWDRHLVSDLGDGFALVFVDRHMIPEVAPMPVLMTRGAGSKPQPPQIPHRSHH